LIFDPGRGSDHAGSLWTHEPSERKSLSAQPLPASPRLLVRLEVAVQQKKHAPQTAASRGEIQIERGKEHGYRKEIAPE
jgi:hypothetical protein